MKATREQIEQREDELAEQEYKVKYIDLPGGIKLNIHNAVLEEFGVRRIFKLTCLDCGKPYEEKVEGNLVEIYTDIQSEMHLESIESICPSCQEIRNRKADREKWFDTP